MNAHSQPRVPEGVPTGGQFAASEKAEPTNVDLVAALDVPTDLSDAIQAADEVRAITARYTDRLNLAGVAAHVRDTYPAAAKMAYRVEYTGEYGDPYATMVYVADANNRVLATFPNPYDNLTYQVPAGLVDEPWGDDTTWGAGWDDDFPDAEPPRFINLDRASRIDVAQAKRDFHDALGRIAAPF